MPAGHTATAPLQKRVKRQNSNYILPLHKSKNKHGFRVLLVCLSLAFWGAVFTISRLSSSFKDEPRGDVFTISGRSSSSSNELRVDPGEDRKEAFQLLQRYIKDAEQVESAGNFEDSEILYRKAHDLAIFHFPEYRVGTSLDVASVLHAQGKFSEAEMLYTTYVLPHLAAVKPHVERLATELETEVLHSLYLLYEVTGQLMLAATAKSELRSRAKAWCDAMGPQITFEVI